MRIEFVIVAITAFLIINTYHDGKYTDMITENTFLLKKYNMAQEHIHKHGVYSTCI